MKHRVMAPLLALALILSACQSPTRGADSAEDYYRGKTVEIIVPFPPGGGTDSQARYMASMLPKFVPGSPTFQVVNIPGAGGAAGANEFAVRAEHDGLTLLYSSGSSVIPYLLRDKSVRYDFRDMTALMGAPQGHVMYVAPGTGVRTVQDMRNRAEPLIMSDTVATSVSAVWLLAIALLDLDVDVVFGYEGRGPAHIAFAQGEVNLDWQSSEAYADSVAPLVESGRAVPVLQHGTVKDGKFQRDPNLPDVPTVAEAYEQIHGRAPSGPEWDAFVAVVTTVLDLQKLLLMHGDSPAEAVEAMRTGVSAMLASDEFWSEQGHNVFRDGVLEDEDLRESFDVLVNIPQETTDWLRGFLSSEYNVSFD